MTENKAIGLAPLITPFAFAFYAFFANIPDFNMDSGLFTYIKLFVGLAFVSIPIAYIYMFFIAGRFFGMLKRRKRVNIFTLTLGAIFVADIPMLFIWPLTQSDSFYLTFQLFSFVGFTIGLNCWFLMNLDRLKNKLNL